MALISFFHLAAVSPTRQRTFRCLAVAHVAIMGAMAAGMSLGGRSSRPMILGQVLLVTGIVEGALLIGWRLTQLPKSQALEFLLVSPLRPPLIFIGEALVGVTWLILVALTGAPLLVLLVALGALAPVDLPTLLLLPAMWGAVTGLALAVWAYELPLVRRWGERVVLAGVIAYLAIGVLAGENLPRWLALLPTGLSRWFIDTFRACHDYNPFGVMKFAMEQPLWAGPRVAWVLGLGLVLCIGLLARGAGRLAGHFHDEHYRPVLLRGSRRRPKVGDYPLTWWAIKRVTKFSGRINLWLASGFAILYASYTVFRDLWPAWLGTRAFLIFDEMGGIPGLTTALVLLAAVPAAFQYGVWDSNASDRRRRLELLLLTGLDGPAYWHASAGAAWNRGRGYVLPALVLWSAGLMAGQLSWGQVLMSAAGGAILWGLYFAIGFWAFSRGTQATVLGLVLTVGLPLGMFLAARQHCTGLAVLVPPGCVYLPMTGAHLPSVVLGPALAAVATLVLARYTLARCDGQLRCWYQMASCQRC